jgi:nicotinamidase/pyrazinamidase
MIDIDCRKDALLLVDIQNDFCEHGALAVPGGSEIAPIVNPLTFYFRYVILTQDWHPAGHKSFASSHPGKQPYDSITWRGRQQTLWPDHCVRGTPGADFHPDLDTDSACLIVRKGANSQVDSYSTFFDNERGESTGLGGALRDYGVKRGFFAGLATDYCVYYSVRDARELGFTAAIILDACRGIDESKDGTRDKALLEMKRAGVAIINSGDIG